MFCVFAPDAAAPINADAGVEGHGTLASLTTVLPAKQMFRVLAVKEKDSLRIAPVAKVLTVLTLIVPFHHLAAPLPDTLNPLFDTFRLIAVAELANELRTYSA